MLEDSVLREQVTYYRERAPEYDECFYCRGRHDRGPTHRADWFREVRTIESKLPPVVRGKKVLELAAGTGLWTTRLINSGARVVAVDSSPETLMINRDRVRSSQVEYQIADIFSWCTSTTFDVVFFSFWLSHVPSRYFDDFWKRVHKALKPNGQVFFIDEQKWTGCEDSQASSRGIVRRKLNDGREFHIVKIFYEPAALYRKLRKLGWLGTVRSSGKFFFYGIVRPRQDC
jgi:2-polyprenyl-3-methyl-5-hydroxy-6-metoxy-1,4-benzoquinol methylase